MHVWTRAASGVAAGVVALAAHGEIIPVSVSDFEYSPSVIAAAPGDTVRFQWVSGFHTVTAGVDCSYDGVGFNGPLYAGSPVFDVVIPEDATDEIPFFCLPHCSFMTGTIVVATAPVCPADLDGSGSVDFSDLLQLLSVWGPCEDCDADLDGDDSVGFNDLLAMLAVWGPC
ncbi:MAG: hypothetical protein KF817_14880 [Phycisphaeraceae bacterium]|nr:hypothetical protein [Phycisphaeraceae bacterium]